MTRRGLPAMVSQYVRKSVKAGSDLTLPYHVLLFFCLNYITFAHFSLEFLPAFFAPQEMKFSETLNELSQKTENPLNAKSDEDSFLLTFCQSLEGIPIGAFRQCPECGKHFLHLSKKEKTFCNNKCAARSGSKARRERIKKTDNEADKKLVADGSKPSRKSQKKDKKRKTRKQ